MIRIIFLSLLTLTLSCGNTRPDPAAITTEKTTPATPAKEPAKVPAEVPTPQPKTTAKVKPTKKIHPAAPAKSVAPTPIAIVEPSSQESATPVEEVTAPETNIPTTEIAEAVQPEEQPATPDSMVIIGMDNPLGVLPLLADSPTAKLNAKTRRHFLPTRRRIDREINKIKFAYKGEVMMGMTASYGTLSSDDTDIMLIIDNINASGTIASVKPFIGYFYRDNNCIGVRLGYNHLSGTLKNSDIDLGESNDLLFNIPYLNSKSNNYSFGIFHRSYAGLDPRGRFGLFAEFELSVATGSSKFAYDDNPPTFSDNTQVKLSFNPGAAVYIFPNVCATLSFGLGGVKYTSVTQKDKDGNKIGSRKSSDMKFKLNIAAINFGLTIHMWDKKKK